MDQIERIKSMEESFNISLEALLQLNNALDLYIKTIPHIKRLDKYYSGRLWRKDFKDDEAGKIPKDMPRGVLSEDGIYNMLLDNKEVLETMKKLAK